MKKYRYYFNDSKESKMEGTLKETTKLLKYVDRYNKPFNNYMHIYKLEGNEYKHIETKCLNSMITLREAYEHIELKNLP